MIAHICCPTLIINVEYLGIMPNDPASKNKVLPPFDTMIKIVSVELQQDRFFQISEYLTFWIAEDPLHPQCNISGLLNEVIQSNYSRLHLEYFYRQQLERRDLHQN